MVGLRAMRLLLTLPLLVALPLLGCSTKPSAGDPPPPPPPSPSSRPSVAAPPPSLSVRAGSPSPTSGILEMTSKGFIRRRSADGVWHDEALIQPNAHGEMLRALWSAGSDLYLSGYAYTGVD